MKPLSTILTISLLAGCGAMPAQTQAPAPPRSPEAALAAVTACKSALAVRESVSSTMVLPVSHVAAAGGEEVFLNLKGVSWLCSTDAYGNVNRLEARR